MNRQQRRASAQNGERLMRKPAGRFIEKNPREENAPEWITRLFINNRYFVMIDDEAKTTAGTAIKAMIRANDAKPFKNHWSEIQKIKNEIFGADAVAVEYYPAEENLADVANIYWIWIFPEGVLPLPV